MSVSHPLLKQLKSHIIALRTDTDPVCDDHPRLKPLCETFEEILRKGIRHSSSLFGSIKKDYWNWIVSLDNEKETKIRINPIFSMVVDHVRKSKKLTTTQGRGRAFLRMALQKKILSVPVEQVIKNNLIHMFYDPQSSILGDEILSEILLSVLFEVTEINFRLNLKITSFLDETWVIPVYKEYEFVPCLDLGVQIQHIGGRVLVASVDQGGVAQEENKLLPGDVLDELLKEPLRNIHKGKIPRLLNQNRGFPVYLSVIKCKLPDGSVFPPVASLLLEVGADQHDLQQVLREEKKRRSRESNKPPPHAQLPEDELNELPVHNAEDSAVHQVQYVARVVIGSDGCVAQIESAIQRVLDTVHPEDNPQELKDVILETGETNVSVTEAESKLSLYKHSYTKISACGRRLDSMKYFAYICGETTCTLAKDFQAYVFKAKTESEAKIILCSIAQGFGRTHWYV